MSTGSMTIAKSLHLVRARQPGRSGAPWWLRYGPPSLLTWYLAQVMPTWIRDWHYLKAGLPGPHFYADHPRVQVGPLALVAAHFLPEAVGAALIAALLGLCLWLVEGVSSRHLPPVASMVAAIPWAYLVSSGHLEDALTIALVLGSLRFPRHGGLLLAAGAACKPWAVVFLPLARGWRQRGIGIAVTALVWLPYVVADPATLRTGKIQYRLSDFSALHLVGVGAHAPSWMRALQLLVAAVVVAVMVRRGQVGLALLAGLAVRIALDPGAWPYFCGPLVVAALLVSRPRLQAALAVAVMFTMTDGAGHHAAVAATRLALLACMVLLGADLPRRRARLHSDAGHDLG